MISIHPFDTKSARNYVGLVNRVRRSRQTIEQLAASDTRAANAGLFRARWLACWAGRPSGTAALLASPYNPPDELDVQIAVLQSARGMGIGTALLSHLLQNASRRSAIAIRCGVKDDDAHSAAWAERRGGTRIHHRCESDLDVTRFDIEAHRERLRRLRDAGYIVRSMAEFGADEYRATLQGLFLSLLSDAPDMKGLPAWTILQAKSVLQDNPNSSPDRQFVACDHSGRWHGITVLTKLEDRGYIFFTGVNRPARGRGLAGVLQGEAIVQALREGFKTVFLNNLSTNAPMVAVNRRLGFQQRPGFWILRKPL
jgi:GNAT superfamily N-acetyltransferase